jgi:hypothetical protein
MFDEERSGGNPWLLVGCGRVTPAFARVTDGGLTALVAFIETSWPRQGNDVMPAESEAGGAKELAPASTTA